MGGWGEVTGHAAEVAQGRAGNAMATVDPALVVAVLTALRHSQATARLWATKSVSAAPNNPVIISSANERRVGLAIQLPTGLAAYVGPTNAVTVAAGAGAPGYQLPTGGGFLFGPENTLDVWIVHGQPSNQDIRVLELFS